MHQALTHRRATWAEAVITTLAVLNAVGALAGAWGLISGVIDLGPTIEERLPFDSQVVAGLALGICVGLPNLVLAVLALARHPLAAPGAIVVGSAMVAWIVVQVAVIRELSFFHPLYLGVGALMVAAGLRQRGDR